MDTSDSLYGTAGVRTLAFLTTDIPPTIDMYGVKHDLEKKIPVHTVPFYTEFYGR